MILWELKVGGTLGSWRFIEIGKNVSTSFFSQGLKSMVLKTGGIHGGAIIPLLGSRDKIPENLVITGNRS